MTPNIDEIIDRLNDCVPTDLLNTTQARAILTEAFGELVRDSQRLDKIGELIKHCPHAEFYWTDFSGDDHPIGYSLYVSGCDPIEINDDSFRGLIDSIPGPLTT